MQATVEKPEVSVQDAVWHELKLNELARFLWEADHARTIIPRPVIIAELNLLGVPVK